MIVSFLPQGQDSEAPLSEATNGATVKQIFWILELWRSKTEFMEKTFQPNSTRPTDPLYRFIHFFSISIIQTNKQRLCILLHSIISLISFSVKNFEQHPSSCSCFDICQWHPAFLPFFLSCYLGDLLLSSVKNQKNKTKKQGMIEFPVTEMRR